MYRGQMGNFYAMPVLRLRYVNAGKPFPSNKTET